MVERGTRIAADAVRAIAGALLLAAVALNLAAVIARYVFLQPILWADEIMVYSMIWAVLLGTAVVTSEGMHLRMEAVYDLFPHWAQRAINLLIAVATVAISIYVISLGLQQMDSLRRNNQHSIAAHIPLEYMYLAIPVGFTLTALAVAARLGLGQELIRAQEVHAVDTLPPDPDSSASERR